MTTIIPVILSGGSGTRLWPLSRSSYPKQFLSLFGDASLFQHAINRLADISLCDHIEMGCPIVVANEEHRFLVLDQLEKSAAGNARACILLEPVGRNTAPALTLAALQALDEYKDPIMIVTPADQSIGDNAEFLRKIMSSVEMIENDPTGKTIGILGVRPSRPEVGYGYIHCANEIGSFGDYCVDQFVEKPNLEKAQSFIQDNSYFWNTGIFILKASTWLSALNKFRQDIESLAKMSWINKVVDQYSSCKFIRPEKISFSKISGESIDYAVIEKCAGSDFSVRMLPLNSGWSDLGSWESVWDASNRDLNGNLALGDVYLDSSKNTLVHASARLVAAVGLKDIVIIETADAVLVLDKSKSQMVKNVISQLDHKDREESHLHRKVLRPWGWYDTIDIGYKFKVKRIQVNPGSSLSLQMHKYRAEHWVIVRGIAKIKNGDQEFTLVENQSTYIPFGQKHRLSNPGVIPLEIIEVQSGEYLGEDDIIRFEDSYGRENEKQ